MLRLLLLTGLWHCALLSHAQTVEDDEAKNIIISQSNENYVFELGKEAHPVVVRKQSSRHYLCQNYRANLPVGEAYSEFTQQVVDSDLRLNGRRTSYTPTCEYYHQDDIFFSDARICHYNVPFEKKGSTAELRFEVLEKDPRYFTSVYFQESQAIKEGSVELKIPSWMKVELKEMNFAGHQISKQQTTDDKGNLVVTYRFQNLPALPRERNKPGPSHYVPHVMVMCKQAALESGTINYFNTLKDQYAWYQKLVKTVANDEAAMAAKAKTITEGITGDENKVKALFLWVQDNVRYIAFEDGLAGFTPAKAQDVLAKRYGDCKGMANLLAELIKASGLDARRCWLGTNHIAYDYSTPSLSVDNHMICAWMKQGKPVFLDPTEKYLGYGELAERIQGRQTLIENGAGYLLETIPVRTEEQNTSTETRRLRLEGTDLVGKVQHVWKGEAKEWMLSGFHALKKEKKESALNNYLTDGDQRYQITNLVTSDLDNYNQDLKVDYDLVWKGAATAFDKELYLDIDNRRKLGTMKVDSNRVLAMWLPYKMHYKVTTELSLPAEKQVQTLPPPVKLQQAGYRLQAGYKSLPGKLLYECDLAVLRPVVPPKEFASFNAAMAQLKAFYEQQLVLVGR